jgi:hypothetical protein
LKWRPSAEGSWQLGIESGFYYNAFLTGFGPDYAGSDYYRVTSEPSPDGSPVTFAARGTERVYLTPVLTTHSDGTTGGSIYLARRLPVAPAFAGQAETLTEFDASASIDLTFTNAVLLSAKAGSALWSAIDAYYSGFFPSSVWSASVASIPVGGSLADYTIDKLIAADFVSRRPWLVAVIVQGANRFYVWENYVADGFGAHVPPGPPRGFWNRTRLYHP